MNLEQVSIYRHIDISSTIHGVRYNTFRARGKSLKFMVSDLHVPWDLFEFVDDYATAHRGQKYVEIWNAARTRKQLLKTQKTYPAASKIGSWRD